jgi:hypothetical protein
MKNSLPARGTHQPMRMYISITGTWITGHGVDTFYPPSSISSRPVWTECTSKSLLPGISVRSVSYGLSTGCLGQCVDVAGGVGFALEAKSYSLKTRG